MSQDPFPATAQPSVRQPWGPFGSIAWAVTGFVAWLAAQMIAIAVYRTLSPDIDLRALETNGFVVALVTTIAGPVWVGVLIFAARRRGWQAQDYLALITPRRSEILFGVACMAALLVALDLLTLAFGRDVVPAIMVKMYTSARAANALVLFFAAVVVVAPVVEEIVFRGFLFRGLSATRLGVAGTIVLISAMWAVIHVQYDWMQLGQIFVIGLLLGWLRWASGSTVLTILLHMLANLAACLQAAIKVEWMG